MKDVWCNITVNGTLSDALRAFKTAAGVTSKDIGNALKTSSHYVDQKMYYNRWTYEDIDLIATALNVNITFMGDSWYIIERRKFENLV